MPETKNIHVKNVDARLWREARAFAVDQGISMHEVVECAIRTMLNEVKNNGRTS